MLKLCRNVLALILSLSGVAYAHGNLKSSVPAKGAHLATAPRELRLNFTEAPELAFSRVALIGPDGRAITLGPQRAASDPRTLVSAITGALVSGVYTVRWQIAGKDGHPVRGEFSFTIAPGAAGLGMPAVTPEPDTAAQPPAATDAHHNPVSAPIGTGFDAGSPGYAAIRWLVFTALLVIIGAVAFRFFVLGFLRRKQNPDSPILADASSVAARLAAWATLLLLVGAVLRLYAQSYALHGADEALNASLVGAMLTKTVWGWGWLVQATAAIAAWIAFRLSIKGSRRAWAAAAVATVALAFTPALSGHAASAQRLVTLAILSDAVHVVGAGGWLGSLVIVIAAGIPAALRLSEGERGPAVADLFNAFSPTALVFAGTAAATGVFAAWLHLGAVPALWTTDYGRTLLWKLAILSVVAGTGAYNWLRVKPSLGNEVATKRVRRSASVELIVAVLVLAVTAVLVATPTAMDLRMAQPSSASAQR